MRYTLLIATLAAPLALTGCYGQVQRIITIDSEPRGAICWLNDNEVGRTPVTVPFTWYGTYSVRLELPGYETLEAAAKVRTPLFEETPLDLAFETVVPGVHADAHDFHYTMKKSEPVDPKALRDRAEAFRRDGATPEQ